MIRLCYFDQKPTKTIVCLVIVVIVTLQIHTYVDCAPTNGSSKNNGAQSNNSSGGGLFRRGALSNLFRRNPSSSTAAPSTSSTNSDDEFTTNATAESSPEQDADSVQNQAEAEAQKFLDSLPGANSNDREPTTFRERVSGTFGVLREGVNNHFRSMRENFSETVDELRDTWSNSSE